MTEVERLVSLVQWYGGKGNIVTKLLKLVPDGGKPYCEPFAGGASLFFAREPSPIEVLNDLDGELVNLFWCFQDPQKFLELRHRIMFTPYARKEFERAIEIIENHSSDDLVLRAWAFFTMLNQTFSGIRHPRTTGRWGRSFAISNGIPRPINNWLKRLSMLDAYHWRLMSAYIENRDAIESIQYWDNDDAVFYVDPPYIQDTRVVKFVYDKEIDLDYYHRLIEVLGNCTGAVVLSGYKHPVYSSLEENGWTRFDLEVTCTATVAHRDYQKNFSFGNTKRPRRIESVWINPKALSLLQAQGKLDYRPDTDQATLFSCSADNDDDSE